MPERSRDAYPLGIMLVRKRVWNNTWREIAYEGIDRLPFLPSVEEQVESRNEGRPRLAGLWDEYWEAKDSRKLFCDRDVVHRLQRAFAEEGQEFDVVYAESEHVVIDPNEDQEKLDRWARNVAQIEIYMEPIRRCWANRPDNLDFLGFDVSTPSPNYHSAIYQPGLARSIPALRHSLNSHGLFDDHATAHRHALIANKQVPRSLPFCVVCVWNDIMV